MYKKLDPGMTDEDVNDMFNTVDTDNDGTISWEEFLKMMAAQDHSEDDEKYIYINVKR